MSGLDLLLPNHSSHTSFHNLALFICHLFIDGHFRNAHILYDPNVFDAHLLNEVDSVCPVQIPWLITDVTQPRSVLWQNDNRTDHILQLIFFDPNHLEDEIHQSKHHLTIYRAFIFTSDVDEFNLRAPITLVKELDRGLGLKSLIVQYKSENVQWNGENDDLGEIFDGKHTKQGEMKDNRHGNLFDRTFGKFEQNLSICIRSYAFTKGKDAASITPTVEQEYLYMSNYFNATLDKSFVHMRFGRLDNIFEPQVDTVVLRRQRKYYKELSLKYEPTETTNA